MTPEDERGRSPAPETREGGTSPGRHVESGSHRRLRWILLLVLLIAAADLSRKPTEQISTAALLKGIDLYQATLSRELPAVGVSCRFHPTCSRYAEAVIRRDGALAGSFKAAVRVARCGPWTPAGTHDPP